MDDGRPSSRAVKKVDVTHVVDHKNDKACPAADQACNWCGVVGHFSPCYPKRYPLALAWGRMGQLQQQRHQHDPPHRHHPGLKSRVPTISIAQPAERQVGRRHCGWSRIGLSHRPRSARGTGHARAGIVLARFDLIMPYKKLPLLSIDQFDMTIRYGNKDAAVTTGHGRPPALLD